MKNETLDQISEWRPKSRWGRRFLASYMKWVVRGGYAFVVLGLGALIFSFVYQVDEVIATEAGDPGWVRGVKTDVGAPGPYLSYRLLAPAHQRVAQGTPVVEVELEGGKKEILLAPKDGILEPDLDATGRGGWAGRPLARIVDYSRLVVEANLKGETSSKAGIGSEARVTSLDVDRDASVIVVNRDGPDGGQSSKRLLPDSAKGDLASLLKGKEVKFDSSRSFQIEGIEKIELEIRKGADKDSQALFDPDRSLVFPGRVESGRHWAKVQFTTSDPAVKAALRDQLGKALGRQAEEPELVVLQAAVVSPATPLSEAQAPAGLEVSRLEQKMEAVVALESPPSWLATLVQEMARQGKKVRAKVEVVTGQVPAAMKLLRRG